MLEKLTKDVKKPSACQQKFVHHLSGPRRRGRKRRSCKKVDDSTDEEYHAEEKIVPPKALRSSGNKTDDSKKEDVFDLSDLANELQMAISLDSEKNGRRRRGRCRKSFVEEDSSSEEVFNDLDERLLAHIEYTRREQFRNEEDLVRRSERSQKLQEMKKLREENEVLLAVEGVKRKRGRKKTIFTVSDVRPQNVIVVKKTVEGGTASPEQNSTSATKSVFNLDESIAKPSPTGIEDLIVLDSGEETDSVLNLDEKHYLEAGEKVPSELITLRVGPQIFKITKVPRRKRSVKRGRKRKEDYELEFGDEEEYQVN